MQIGFKMASLSSELETTTSIIEAMSVAREVEGLLLEFNETDLYLDNDTLTLPDSINTEDIVNDLKFDTAYTNEQEVFNDRVKFLLERKEITKFFIQRVYCKHLSFFPKKYTNSTLNQFYTDSHDFVSSSLYHNYVRQLFTTSELESIHFRVAFGITEVVRSKIVIDATKEITQTCNFEQISKLKSFKDCEEGDGILRYLASWCIGRTLDEKRRYISSDSFSDETATNAYKSVIFLEQLLSKEDSLDDTPSAKGSLKLPKLKDTNLCSVTDKAFSFFQHVEKAIQNYETHEQMFVHGKNMFKVVYESIDNDQELLEMWKQLYEGSDDEMCEQLIKLKSEIVKKYLTTTLDQFKKDYVKNAHNTENQTKEAKSKKSKAHSLGKKKTNAASNSKENGKTKKRQDSGKGKAKLKKQRTVEFPCGKCEDNCELNCVCCDKCGTWYHFECMGLTGDDEELGNDQWLCYICKMC